MATVSLTPRMIRKLAVDRPALAKALAAQDQVKVENAEDMQTAFVRFPLQHSALSANAQAECTAVEGTGEASIVIDSCWEKFFEPSAPQGGYQAGDLVLLDGQPAVVLRELRMLSLMATCSMRSPKR